MNKQKKKRERLFLFNLAINTIKILVLTDIITNNCLNVWSYNVILTLLFYYTFKYIIIINKRG